MWAHPYLISGEYGELVVGDMDGNMTFFKSVVDSSKKSAKDFIKKQVRKKFRQFGITKIIVLMGHNLLITNANDYSGTY